MVYRLAKLRILERSKGGAPAWLEMEPFSDPRPGEPIIEAYLPSHRRDS